MKIYSAHHKRHAVLLLNDNTESEANGVVVLFSLIMNWDPVELYDTYGKTVA